MAMVRGYSFSLHIMMCSLFLIGILASGCANPLFLRVPTVSQMDEPVADSTQELPETAQRVLIATSDFSLAWDYDASEPGTYSVYYRRINEGDWQILVAELTNPLVKVNTSMLGVGEFELAVSFKTIRGVESELHSSFDITAVPDCGWYIAIETETP
jgi:hypothetical protein